MGKPPLTLISYLQTRNWKSFHNVLNEMVTVVLETVEDVWYDLWEGGGGGVWGASWEEEHLFGAHQLVEGGSSRWAEPGEGKHAANSDTK